MPRFNKKISDCNNFVFLSPHLDDAILSCGILISDLCKENKNITILTVFTKAMPKTITPQAKDFMKICKEKRSSGLFKKRVLEDKNLCKYLNIKFIHLGHVDAAWRLDSKQNPVYPVPEDQYSRKISKNDNNMINKITSDINRIVKEQGGDTLVLGPLSVGNHVDHIIANRILSKMRIQKLFWSDFPYNTKVKITKNFLSDNKVRLFTKISKFSFFKKERLIGYYKSQIRCLFPSGKIPHTSENYYIPSP